MPEPQPDAQSIIYGVIPLNPLGFPGPYTPAPGSLKVLCELCSEPAWMGPQCYAKYLETPGKVICAHCIGRLCHQQGVHPSNLQVQIVPRQPGAKP